MKITANPSSLLNFVENATLDYMLLTHKNMTKKKPVEKEKIFENSYITTNLAINGLKWEQQPIEVMLTIARALENMSKVFLISPTVNLNRAIEVDNMDILGTQTVGMKDTATIKRKLTAEGATIKPTNYEEDDEED